MRRFTVRLAAMCICLLMTLGGALTAVPGIAFAATTLVTTISIQQTPPPSSAPDLIVTSIAGNALPQYVELYNQGNAPLNLSNWQLTFTVHDSNTAGCTDITTGIPMPKGWLLSKRYLTFERTATPAAGSLTIPFSVDETTVLSGCLSPRLASLTLAQDASEPEQLVAIPANEWSPTATTVVQHKQRNNSSSSTRAVTGTFDADYKVATGAITLNSDPLYAPPADAAGLQLLEVLPNARSCSPLETDPTCSDYIKFFNPTDQPINLASYRLRIGHQGISESITNTFTWGKDIDPANDELMLLPQQYLMLTNRNDGQPLSITDGGSYIWLEDAYGTTIYDPVVTYPDASSTSKVGQAWAFDGASWQWTAAPRPGEPNYFPPLVTPPVSDTASVSIDATLKPCAANQYRNQATNRFAIAFLPPVPRLAHATPAKSATPTRTVAVQSPLLRQH